ncbi:MAG: hypothetical protein QNJ46_00140 [Leptolyngbyaceae cyanobacterium MO_188.B28]|nr:hypothetical protein [Leptolyngbyaceae cyanobacterium MO_188.B28]
MLLGLYMQRVCNRDSPLDMNTEGCVENNTFSVIRDELIGSIVNAQ